MYYLLPAVSAFLLTLFLILIAIRVFPKIGLMDQPKKYGLKRDPIPYPGGILLYVAFVILTLIFLEPTVKLAGVWIGGGLLVAVNFIDDRISLPPWFRLLIQLITGLIIVMAGIGVTHVTNPFGGQIRFDEILLTMQIGDYKNTIMVVSGLFTMGWILLITNTMNWLDGIPGMASGITVIGGTTLFLLSISDFVNQPEVAMLAITIAAMAFAFWLFDFYPPKILMGDSGSMFFGLLLAVTAIFSGGKIATAFLILGFPILDALYVIVHRLFNLQAPWKGGEWDKHRKAVHLHHRLLQFGLSERQALTLIYILSTIFGAIALLVGTKGKFWAILAVAVFSFIIGLILHAKQKSALQAGKKD